MYLFPSFRTGKPIAQKTITEAKWVLRGENRAKNYNFQAHQLWPKDMEDWNPHDLRRTLRTNLSRLGCPTDIAEAVLGHSKKESKVPIICILTKKSVQFGYRSGLII